MNIFVTGAGGFIGRSLAAHLTRAGHILTTHSGRADGPVTVPKNADAVINAAGRLGGGNIPETEVSQANTLLPEQIGLQCVSAGIPLIHLSTPGVCGLLADGREDAPLAPEGPYERSKAEGETRLASLGFPPGGLTVLRPDFVFGAGDRHKLALFRQVARGWFPVVGRSGPLTRPTHARDVCRAVQYSLPGGILAGGLYNIGGPEVLTMAEVVRTAAAAQGRRVFVVSTPRRLLRAVLALGPLCPAPLTESRLRLFGTDRFVSVEKAAAAGFTPMFSFAEAAGDAVSWYRSEKLL